MTGITDDPLISTLLGQPVVVWSLAISGAIFVLAIILAAFFKLRNSVKARQSEKIAAAKESPTAPGEFVGVNKDNKDLSQLKNSEPLASSDKTVASGEVGARTVGTVETAVPATETDTLVKAVEVTGEDTQEEDNESESETKSESESEESKGEKSALASIFEDNIIVDPHIQAMRDSLPAIDIIKLQEDARSAISQLRERETA